MHNFAAQLCLHPKHNSSNPDCRFLLGTCPRSSLLQGGCAGRAYYREFSGRTGRGSLRSTTEYKVDGLVVLNARNVKTKWPTSKLSPNSYGTIQLTRFGTPTCTQGLGKRWNICPVLLTTHHIGRSQNPIRRGLPRQPWVPPSQEET